MPQMALCRVPKLFCLPSKLGRIVQDMKLNKTKVRYILSQNRNGVATIEIARDVKVSHRRVQQIIKGYTETGLEPILGEKVGCPPQTLPRKSRSVGSGFVMNESTACLLGISTGTNGMGLMLRSA
jgi:hypothetical protein